MTVPAPSTSVMSGTRRYYEEFCALAAEERPDLPAFDDLTRDQIRAWMLAYAASVELSVRIADAVLSVVGAQ